LSLSDHVVEDPGEDNPVVFSEEEESGDSSSTSEDTQSQKGEQSVKDGEEASVSEDDNCSTASPKSESCKQDQGSSGEGEAHTDKTSNSSSESSETTENGKTGDSSSTQNEAESMDGKQVGSHPAGGEPPKSSSPDRLIWSGEKGFNPDFDREVFYS
jgi:clumping factor A